MIKKCFKEIILVLIQLFMFYIFPLFAGQTDAMGMVFLILVATLIVSIIFTIVSKFKIKYLYPIFVALLFIPSVFIYYNESALIHSIWYLLDSYLGIIVGIIFNKIRK